MNKIAGLIFLARCAFLEIAWRIGAEIRAFPVLAREFFTEWPQRVEDTKPPETEKPREGWRGFMS